MSITINHGNIASALGLAAAAGKAEGQRRASQEDLQYAGLAQQAKAESDSNYARQIQLALTGNEQQREADIQKNALAQREADSVQQQANTDRNYGLNVASLQQQEADRAATRDLSGQRLAATQQFQGQRLGIASDAQDTRQQNADRQSADSNAKQKAIAALPPELQNIVAATGRLPYIPSSIGNDSETKTLESEYNRIAGSLTKAKKEQQAFAVDPKDILGPRSQQGSLPGVAKGYEARWQDKQRTIEAIQQELDTLDHALHQRTQSLLDPTQNQSTPAARAVIDYFRAIGQGGQPQQQPAAQPDAGTAPGAQTSDGTAVVHNAAEYAALPSGASYVNAKTGQRATKP